MEELGKGRQEWDLRPGFANLKPREIQKVMDGGNRMPTFGGPVSASSGGHFITFVIKRAFGEVAIIFS